MTKTIPYPAGPVSPAERAMVADLGTTLAAVRSERPDAYRSFMAICKIILDAQRGFIYTLPNMTAGEVPAMSARFVSYLRVSTRKQEASGLGLEAQRADVAAFVSRTGGEAVREFVEVESGKANDRKELAAALAFARRSKATLLVAKLDRLSRNVAFLATLMESGVDFIACDNPHANRLTLHILGSMAEHEREMISKRTKDALAAAKARGAKLGSAREGHWEGREAARIEGAHKGGERAAEVHRKRAREAYGDVLPLMREMREGGASLRKIAERLNGDGIPTRRGKAWTAMQVKNVLDRE